jgi:hypothetical protein
MNLTLEMLACQGKTKHLTRDAANIEMKRVHKDSKSYGKLNVYKCQFCNNFHVGRKSKK